MLLTILCLQIALKGPKPFVNLSTLALCVFQGADKSSDFLVDFFHPHLDLPRFSGLVLVRAPPFPHFFRSLEP
jgi:hypothetical protein